VQNRAEAFGVIETDSGAIGAEAIGVIEAEAIHAEVSAIEAIGTSLVQLELKQMVYLKLKQLM
jgi:hypothetical protein